MEAGHALSPPILAALEKKGFVELTPVQRAVLEVEHAGRDLRITSQTGSGKTVAIGLVLADWVAPDPSLSERSRKPRALVITPTRELARQVEEELSWLYALVGARVTSLTGGASYRNEFRALALGPAVLVGTPGRVVDHLERGSFDTSEIRAVVLDEADRMLDMGFRDELEAILAKMPAERRTHLVSATFPADVKRLADRVQADPVHVEGTKLGEANVDIDHAVYLVDPSEKLAALINLLLLDHEARALVFAQMRAEVSEIAADLADAGFGVAAMSGDLEQRERTRALEGFKSGRTRVLVATDVAARGIDVENIQLVIQVTPPTDADTYTHRSGRTGRAGKRGKCAMLVSLREFAYAKRVLERAKVKWSLANVPARAAIEAIEDERFIEQVRALASREEAIHPRVERLARRIEAELPTQRALSVLIEKHGPIGEAAPREVTPIVPPAPRSRPRAVPPRADRAEPRGSRGEPRPDRGEPRPDRGEPRPDRGEPRAPKGEGDFVPFRVTWGAKHGADSRRLLAMVCRRGDVQSRSIGSIRVGPIASTVEVERAVAQQFAAAAGRPDPRDPRVRISMADDAVAEHRAPPAPKSRPRTPAAVAPAAPPRAPKIEEAPKAPPPRRSSKGGRKAPPVLVDDGGWDTLAPAKPEPPRKLPAPVRREVGGKGAPPKRRAPLGRSERRR
ncbi:MAG: DEAD/DEAH box helicase [Polyangiaceae bacterium]